MIGIEWRATHKTYKGLADEFKDKPSMKAAHVHVLSKIITLELNAFKLGVKL